MYPFPRQRYAAAQGQPHGDILYRTKRGVQEDRGSYRIVWKGKKVR